MSTLHISCWFGGNGTCGVGIHGIVMFFMYLDILAKFSTDVLVIVDLGASHQFSGIDISGYTISQGVYVEPKIACADHLNYQYSW